MIAALAAIVIAVLIAALVFDFLGANGGLRLYSAFGLFNAILSGLAAVFLIFGGLVTAGAVLLTIAVFLGFTHFFVVKDGADAAEGASTGVRAFLAGQR